MLELHLPPEDQRFTCQSSGYCCRDWQVPVGDDEVARYEEDRDVWTARRPLLAAHPFAIRPPHARDNGQVLNFTPGEGSCTFLTGGNLCDLHRHKGARYKPLACQQFPFRFTVTPIGTFVGMSFSCPTVRANQGARIASDIEAGRIQAFLERTGKIEKVPDGSETAQLLRGVRVQWSELIRIDAAVAQVLATESLHVLRRLVVVDRIATQIQLALELEIEMGATDRHSIGERLADRAQRPLDQLIEHAQSELYERPRLRLFERNNWARLLMLLRDKREFFWAEHSGFSRLVARVGKARQRFGLLAGQPWRLGGLPKPVSAREIERVYPALPDESAELLGRWFRVKVAGKDFFGPQHYGLSYVGGLRFLLMLAAAAVYAGRAHAAAHDRKVLEPDDVGFGVRLVEDSLMSSNPRPASFERDWELMLTRRSGAARRLLLAFAATDDMIGEASTQMFQAGTIEPKGVPPISTRSAKVVPVPSNPKRPSTVNLEPDDAPGSSMLPAMSDDCDDDSPGSPRGGVGDKPSTP